MAQKVGFDDLKVLGLDVEGAANEEVVEDGEEQNKRFQVIVGVRGFVNEIKECSPK